VRGGNETWLVPGGSLLIATFPVAYLILPPAFYLPVMLMLLEAGPSRPS
jgi:cytochrome d ubiquinol oxidase subunit II